MSKLQLVAQGAQNIILNGNPEVTFFKTVYLRHTNFSIEEQPQAFNNTPAMGKMSSCTISRSGDLLGYTYLETNWKTQIQVNSFFPMEQMLSSVELRIGNQRIDFYDQTWMAFWRNWERIYSRSSHKSDFGNWKGI